MAPDTDLLCKHMTVVKIQSQEKAWETECPKEYSSLKRNTQWGLVWGNLTDTQASAGMSEGARPAPVATQEL